MVIQILSNLLVWGLWITHKIFFVMGGGELLDQIISMHCKFTITIKGSEVIPLTMACDGVLMAPKKKRNEK